MADSLIARFTDAVSPPARIAGGKGANLALLVGEGFNVPPGFIVTTQAYDEFMSQHHISERVEAILRRLPRDEPDALEAATASIRQAIQKAELTEDLRSEIAAAYRELGFGSYVAVRSSGTSEDLEGSSFAGLHDTYLDITGIDELVVAIKDCWASLWTARATSYRTTRRFDHLDASIAVVVQAMIAADVAGVMFTANPMNAATDELLINASWGLGEGVVSGSATPDEFTVSHRDRSVLRRTLGRKHTQVVRNQARGGGTIEVPVPVEQQERFCLNDQQLVSLSELGLRVQKAYQDLPQDIEWALVDGQFYVLQSRPITGVEFSWDADITRSVRGGDEPDTLWSRRIADEWWNGAVTPLMFSTRAHEMAELHDYAVHLWGFPELSATTRKLWKYYKGEVYYNIAIERDTTQLLFPPQFRVAKVPLLPTTWQEETLKAPFDWQRYFAMWERIEAVDTKGARLDWQAYQNEHYFERPEIVKKHSGLSPQELRDLSDADLRRYIDEMVALEVEYGHCPWTGEFLHYTQAIMLMQQMLGGWYDGNPDILADLLAGSAEQTPTSVENLSQHALAERIRHSNVLLSAFRKNKGRAFFAACDQCGEDGRNFLTAYGAHVEAHGHRGHADRDYYFTRRAEDPMVDYRAFEMMLNAESVLNEHERDRAANQRRQQATETVLASIRAKPLGMLKAQAFEFVLDYVQRSIVARDKERYFADRTTYAQKKGVVELNRRCMARGLFETERDFYFLTLPELYDYYDGKASVPLVKAKIAARMRNFDRFDNKEFAPPVYIKHDLPFDLDAPVQADDGVLRGKATSKGKVTGTARVIKTLNEIDRLQAGDIMVVNSTDPGWTTAFLVVKGIVLETGGVLSHGSLLAREYGLPAVQLERAMSLIPDGATVCVDGNNGTVTLAGSATHQNQVSP